MTDGSQKWNRSSQIKLVCLDLFLEFYFRSKGRSELGNYEVVNKIFLSVLVVHSYDVSLCAMPVVLDNLGA